MNYYPHHIGDFNNATRHLTRIERSVYRDLIELYYDTEHPLNPDIDSLCRKIIARSEEERTAVEQVLNEFFTLDENGYVNGRCQSVVDDYQNSIHNKSKAGKASAKARKANKHKGSSKSTGVDNRKPRTNNQKPDIYIPYQQIADAYNKFFAEVTGNPIVKDPDKLSPARKKTVKARFNYNTDSDNANTLTNNVEYWERYFTYCSTLPFMQIDAHRGQGHETWKPNFDFLIKESTFTKVREGSYE